MKDKIKEALFKTYLEEISSFKEELKMTHCAFIDDTTNIFNIGSAAFLEYNNTLDYVCLSISAITFIEPYMDVYLVNYLVKNILKDYNVESYIELHLMENNDNDDVNYIIKNEYLSSILKKAYELEIDKTKFNLSIMILIDKDFESIKEFSEIIDKILNPDFKQCRKNKISKILDKNSKNKNFDLVQKMLLSCYI